LQEFHGIGGWSQHALTSRLLKNLVGFADEAGSSRFWM
jgi:hypothetical protein